MEKSFFLHLRGEDGEEVGVEIQPCQTGNFPEVSSMSY